jgi:hypothetical protein
MRIRAAGYTGSPARLRAARGPRGASLHRGDVRRVLLALACASLSGAACTKEEPPRAAPPLAAPPPPAPGYGTVMADVARRFELLGRAVAGGRIELAAYELDEIGEAFEEQIPRATLPKEGTPAVLPAMARAFRESTLPEMEKALKSKDRAAITKAFENTATACNVCHQASGHGFIEVPTVPGRSVPETGAVGK